jgi:hypothetical protein
MPENPGKKTPSLERRTMVARGKALVKHNLGQRMIGVEGVLARSFGAVESEK